MAIRPPAHKIIRLCNAGLARMRVLVEMLRAKRCVLLNASISAAPGARLGKGVRITAFDGGTVRIGRNFFAENGVQITAGGGQIQIGNDVFIGVGSIVCSQESILIGDDCQIAEYTVIRDQDHATAVRPIRMSGFVTSPISIGPDVWLGAKATVLRGAMIGEGAVIGAHALVKSNVPAYKTAVGIPAKIVE